MSRSSRAAARGGATRARRWVAVPFVLVAAAVSVWAYPRLPAEVPRHWGPDGRVDGWVPRETAVTAMPLLVLALWLFLARVSSAEQRALSGGVATRNRDAADAIALAAVAVLTAVHAAMLGAVLGWGLPVPMLAPLSVGIAWVVIGSLLPRARYNAPLGIRTPWTIANTRVWRMTHRVGGVVFGSIGVAIAALAFVRHRWAILLALALMLGGTLGIVVWSHHAWRRTTRR